MTRELARTITAIVAAFGGLVGVVTLILALMEYARNNSQKRVEFYFELEKRLLQDPTFKQIRDLLHHRGGGAQGKISDIPWLDRNDYAGFFENIAVLVKSGCLSKEVACYMFSQDAIRCWDSNEFWQGFLKDEPYWWVLRDFVAEMRTLRANLQGCPNKLKM